MPFDWPSIPPGFDNSRGDVEAAGLSRRCQLDRSLVHDGVPPFGSALVIVLDGVFHLPGGDAEVVRQTITVRLGN
jgi:hypothetical protein